MTKIFIVAVRSKTPKKTQRKYVRFGIYATLRFLSDLFYASGNVISEMAVRDNC